MNKYTVLLVHLLPSPSLRSKPAYNTICHMKPLHYPSVARPLPLVWNKLIIFNPYKINRINAGIVQPARKTAVIPISIPKSDPKFPIRIGRAPKINSKSAHTNPRPLPPNLFLLGIVLHKSINDTGCMGSLFRGSHGLIEGDEAVK